MHNKWHHCPIWEIIITIKLPLNVTFFKIKVLFARFKYARTHLQLKASGQNLFSWTRSWKLICGCALLHRNSPRKEEWGGGVSEETDHRTRTDSSALALQIGSAWLSSHWRQINLAEKLLKPKTNRNRNRNWIWISIWKTKKYLRTATALVVVSVPYVLSKYCHCHKFLKSYANGLHDFRIIALLPRRSQSHAIWVLVPQSLQLEDSAL